MKEIEGKPLNTVRIKLDCNGLGGVWIGDYKVPFTRDVRLIEGRVGQVPVIELEVMCIDGIEIEADAQVTVNLVKPMEQ
jgi:hypothetical protein